MKTKLLILFAIFFVIYSALVIMRIYDMNIEIDQLKSVIDQLRNALIELQIKP